PPARKGCRTDSAGSRGSSAPEQAPRPETQGRSATPRPGPSTSNQASKTSHRASAMVRATGRAAHTPPASAALGCCGRELEGGLYPRRVTELRAEGRGRFEIVADPPREESIDIR